MSQINTKSKMQLNKELSKQPRAKQKHKSPLDTANELQQKLGLTSFGIPQPELKPIPPPEKPTDLPSKVKDLLNP